MKYTSYEQFFTTLGNSNRLTIIYYLAKHGPSNVSDICAGTKLEQTVVSHNLRRLLTCHFVHREPRGREKIYDINKTTIKPLLTLIDKHVADFCGRSTCDKCKYA